MVRKKKNRSPVSESRCVRERRPMRVRQLGERMIHEDAQRGTRHEVAESCGDAETTNGYGSHAGGITCEKGMGCEVGVEML